MIYGAEYLAQMETKVVEPFCERSTFDWNGMKLSYGLGFGSYDVRLDQELRITRHDGMVLASTFEKFKMPGYMLGIVHDKSSLVRLGLTVQNTLIDPGWRGFLTLELLYHNSGFVRLKKGMPIAQIAFHYVEGGRAYEGKYQDQEEGPQGARG